MLGLQGLQLRAPEANSTVLSHCYDGAIMVGVDVDNGNAVSQRLRGGWQSKRHLFTAFRTFLLLLVLLQHVRAELTLHHITVC